MTLRLPRLNSTDPIVDDSQRPSFVFQRFWQSAMLAIEEAFDAQALAIEAIAAAQAAADNANAAAEVAQEAATTATATTAVATSYIVPDGVLTAAPLIITVAAHTRYYADGTSVAVSGGTVAATGTGDTDYVFYDQPSRAGGSVTYQVSTTAPAQTVSRHVVGAVTIPASGSTLGGKGPQRPGEVQP